MKPLTQEQANAVYTILEKTCGAFPQDRFSFVYEFTQESEYSPTSEWRFCGDLGFGGKFRFPRITVDCYREDETEERLAQIKKANEELSAIRDEYHRDGPALIKFEDS